MGKVEIIGLREWRAAVKKASGPEATKAFRDANYEAAEIVRKASQATASTVGRLAAKAASSLRSTKTASYAAVRGGGGHYPFFYGAIFGALQYPQFKSWLGNSTDAGYFLYPDLREREGEVLRTFEEAVDRITHDAFPGR